MPLIFENSYPVINYNSLAKDKYWKQLSIHVINKFGKRRFDNHYDVENILVSGFDFLINEFKKKLLGNKNFNFFLYTYHLHEESVKLFVEIQDGYELKFINETEFAMYRRVLKLILEQGCDIDLNWGEDISEEEFNTQIQDLIYLGHWLYTFADIISLHKMIEECHFITFNDKDVLTINWNHHYGKIYSIFFPEMVAGYMKSVHDFAAVPLFIKKIEENFKIDYGFALGNIEKIKEHHNPKNPNIQTVDTDVLPINLSNLYDISLNEAQLFYNGLTISRNNKLTIQDSILKPHSMNRYLFRPILEYNVGGMKRALVGTNKMAESIFVSATNALNWNMVIQEWKLNKGFKDFVNKKSLEHDKILEDEIENILINDEYLYCRNIKSFKTKKDSIRIDNQLAGEIDFIIINSDIKKIFVAETKYNRARYECVGFRTDYSNFIKCYEPQLNKKTKWINDNIKILSNHLSIIYNKIDLDFSDYNVEGIFFINTPTFYMFNGSFKAITLNKISNYLRGIEVYPDFGFSENLNSGEIRKYIVKHPYFKKY